MEKFFLKKKIIIIILIAILVIITSISLSLKNAEKSKTDRSQITVKNCENIPELPDGAKRLVTKVIDGDTFLIEGGYSVRILGIDADERGYLCYEAAKEKLEELILNKEVKLEKSKEDFDQYCRYLRYVFLDDKNISLELVKEGLVVSRFSPEDKKYREEITKAEKKVREDKIGCKWGEIKNTKENKNEFQWEKLTPELTGLKVIGACQARDYHGKEIIVEGKVADVYLSKTNTLFLNFEKPYPNQCFTGVIFSSNLYKFAKDPENYYLNKTVRIRGEIKEYRGKPEIILEKPDQIEVGR
jgi:micrococcal nuclease